MDIVKDIASFVPSYVYKVILFVAVFEIIHRKIKKYLKRI